MTAGPPHMSYGAEFNSGITRVFMGLIKLKMPDR